MWGEGPVHVQIAVIWFLCGLLIVDLRREAMKQQPTFLHEDGMLLLIPRCNPVCVRYLEAKESQNIYAYDAKNTEER